MASLCTMAVSTFPKKRRPGRPSSRKAGTTRQDLLHAAIDLFGERGFEGVSLSQIAGKAGTDIGLTRYYFGSKEELWKASIDHLAQLLTAELNQIVETEAVSHTGQMKAVIRWFVMMSARYPQLGESASSLPTQGPLSYWPATSRLASYQPPSFHSLLDLPGHLR